MYTAYRRYSTIKLDDMQLSERLISHRQEQIKNIPICMDANIISTRRVVFDPTDRLRMTRFLIDTCLADIGMNFAILLSIDSKIAKLYVKRYEN